MVEWDHKDDWDVADFSGKGSRSGELVVNVDLSKEEDQFYAGHAIDGRVLFPATGYLVRPIRIRPFPLYVLTFPLFVRRLWRGRRWPS